MSLELQVPAISNGHVDERAMAAVAKAAVFREALLTAVRARVNELRMVAK